MVDVLLVVDIVVVVFLSGVVVEKGRRRDNDPWIEKDRCGACPTTKADLALTDVGHANTTDRIIILDVIVPMNQ